jgi:Fic family protein
MEGDSNFAQRYPHIQFRKHWQLSSAVWYQLGECHAVVEAISAMPMQPAYHEDLLKVSLQKGARATTAIEGNTLTEDEVRKVSEGVELPKSKAYQAREVANVLEAMNGILESVSFEGETSLITPESIKGLHRKVGKELGEHFDAIPGRFRQDERVVGPYKCPRHEDVPELVRLLCQWLPKEFGYPTGKQTFADAVVQAIVTHVYIEWIHPFGDGNGRTGRLLEFYILLRANNPDIASHILSNHYNQTRPEYYRQLDRANKDRDLSAFIDYAVQGYRDGLVQTIHAVQESAISVAWRHLVHSEFTREKADQAKQTKQPVLKRRRTLVLAMAPQRTYSVHELGVINTEIAKIYATVSPRTLIRDILELEAMKLIEKTPDDRWRINMGLLLPHFAQRRNR